MIFCIFLYDVLDSARYLGYNLRKSRGAENKISRKKRGNAPVKGFAAEIHTRFPSVMGWSPAEYVWDCHFMWSATFGLVFMPQSIALRHYFI
jgi:hypothetical protein